MPALKNDNFLRALDFQPVDRTPIWVMRQAGRYLPEYRKVREKAGDFMTLCKTPELACEVTLQPLRRFDLDASIIFSDILTIPDAMGLGLFFEEGEGPIFKNPIKNIHDIKNLPPLDPNLDLSYVMDAIRLTQKALGHKIPLLGFSGSPFTLATYMIEGRSSKQFSKIKQWLYQEPTCLHLLLEKLTQAVSDYLLAQIQAGVNAVMLFDTWGGILSTSAYFEFSLAYMAKIINNLKVKTETPIIIFAKQASLWLEAIADTGCKAISLDWTIDIAQAKARLGNKVALQGNLDPCVLFASPEVIEKEAKKILTSLKGEPGYIFNLGHGILPETPPEHLQILIELVHSFKN